MDTVVTDGKWHSLEWTLVDVDITLVLDSMTLNTKTLIDIYHENTSFEVIMYLGARQLLPGGLFQNTNS